MLDWAAAVGEPHRRTKLAHQASNLANFMPQESTNGLRAIAFQKIGRNVVNLQRFERMLKLIVVQNNLSGYASELAKIHQNKTQGTNYRTLGSLVREFFDTIYSNDDPFSDGPAEALNDIWISYAFRIQSNRDPTSTGECELREVVVERNLLIHHWLAEVDFESVDECQELISRLDAQDDRLKPHYESLMRQLGNMRAAQEAVLKLLEAELRKSSQTEKDTA